MKTVVFIGAPSGDALRLIERESPGARALVIEPRPPAVARVLARTDVAAWKAAGRLALLGGPDYAGAATIVRDFPDLHAAAVIVAPELSACDRPAADAAADLLARLAFSAKANDGARRASAARYLLHTLANAPSMARESDVGALAGLGAGLPAIVAAAGPSLDVNIPALQPVRDRGVLIACDTAARPLVLSGMAPDLIVASDPSPANAGHVTSLPAARGFLVAEGSLHPSAIAAFGHRTFVFRVAPHEPWPWLGTLGLDRGLLATWGSVATSAFSLALVLGCNPIIFVGADFAFTGGRPYCRGTAFETQWSTWAARGATAESIWDALVSRWPPAMADDIDGRAARTAAHLLSFRDWIVEHAAGHPDTTVVNATRAGLLHGPSIEQRGLAEVLASAAVVDGEALHRELRRRHASARASLGVVLGGVHDVLGDPAHPVRERWKTFTDGAVTDEAINAALRSPEYMAWNLGRTCPTRSKEAL